MKAILAGAWLLLPAVLSAIDDIIPDENCLECHSDKDLKMEKDGAEVSIFVDEEKLRASVHGKNHCAECHKDLTAEHPDDEKPAQKVDCAKCHEKQSVSFGASVHGLAGRARACRACRQRCHSHLRRLPRNP